MEVASILTDMEKGKDSSNYKEYHPSNHLDAMESAKAVQATQNQLSFPDPASLGLAGFACTTFILSVLNAKLLPSEIINGVVGPGFFYGGATQFIAGLMCFVTRNTFGFVGLTSYGAFWLAVSTLFTLEAENDLVFGGKSNKVIGILLVGYAIFSLYLWVGALAHHLALVITITFLEMTLILLALANFGVISSVPGGVTGILLAGGGWYISAAIFINENFRRTVVPLGPSQNIPFLKNIAPKL
jgi:succinate-acetate transporter protein